MSGTTRAKELAEELNRDKYQDVQSFLLFRNNPDEQCAIPLDLVERVEQIRAADIESIGGQRVIQYRGNSMPLFNLHEVADQVNALPQMPQYIVIVFSIAGRDVGLLGITPVDAVETKITVDRSTLKQKGIMGSAIIGNRTTMIIDIHEFMETVVPDWFKERKKAAKLSDEGTFILLAEDSDFFRNQVKKFMEDEGYKVLAAEDGMKAWELLQDNADKVKLVVTDIEMPNLDGYGLTRNIKNDNRFASLPVIAVTSLASEDDMAKGKQAGVDDYQVKLDKEQLLGRIYSYLHG
jgi:two-component system, chemotaxis family, sensor kinase CheA